MNDKQYLLGLLIKMNKAFKFIMSTTVPVKRTGYYSLMNSVRADKIGRLVTVHMTLLSVGFDIIRHS